jgi:hypothetical protein
MMMGVVVLYGCWVKGCGNREGIRVRERENEGAG